MKIQKKIVLLTTQALFFIASGSALAADTPALDTGNSFGNAVTCSSPCYDFTVYDTAGTGYGATTGSKGYFEALISYSGTAPTIQAMYFTASGITTPGATTSTWAPLVNLNLTTTITTGPNAGTYSTGFTDPNGALGNASLSGAVASTVLNISGKNAGQFYSTSGSGAGATIDFTGSTGHVYQLTFSSRNNAAGSAAIQDLTTNLPIAAGSSLSYYSTSKYINSIVNTSTELIPTGSTPALFGGQIAPEMSPLLSYNVFALLGCLFLLFSGKKYIAKHNQQTIGCLSIA